MQKLARFLACSCVLVAISLSASGTALGMSHVRGEKSYPIYVPVNSDGTWTPVVTDFDTKKESPGGKIILRFAGPNNPGGCIRLRESHSRTPLGDEKCGGQNAKPMEVANGVALDTKYYIEVKKFDNGPNNHFDGWLEQ
jgi:hypothetical protein